MTRLLFILLTLLFSLSGPAMGANNDFCHSSFAANKGGNLFRVVDDFELADIRQAGQFRTAPGSFEGKQFVDNLGDAQALQKRFSDFFGGNQTIVRGQAPQSVLDNASRIPFSDIPNGTAITIPTADLLKVIPKH